MTSHDTPQPIPAGCLATRTALVTGSSSGIGAATARTLAAEGAHVLVSGRDAVRDAAVVDEIVGLGGRADFVTVDLGGSYADIRAFAAEATRVLGGRIDVPVSNAGIYPATPTPDLDDADLDAMLAVNIRAPHVLVASLAPTMAERGSGAIVTIGSWMAQTGMPFGAMYSATKAADEQLTRSWAAEFGPRGVRVNALPPRGDAHPGQRGQRRRPGRDDGRDPRRHGRLTGRHRARRPVPGVERRPDGPRHHALRRRRDLGHPPALTACPSPGEWRRTAAFQRRIQPFCATRGEVALQVDRADPELSLVASPGVPRDAAG